jgi:hypothetical protein
MTSPQTHAAVDVDALLNLFVQEQQLTPTECIFKLLCVDESLCMNEPNPLYVLPPSPVSGKLLLLPTVSGVTDNRHVATTHVGNWVLPSLIHFALLQILNIVCVCVRACVRVCVRACVCVCVVSLTILLVAL